MAARDLVRFSAQALRGHRLRSALSLVGVGIGVAAVVLLTSLGEGARTYVVGEFSTLGTNLLIVLPGKTETTGMMPVMGGVPHDLTLADVEAIERQVPWVRRVAPVSLGTATASFGSRSREITVVGTNSAMLELRQLKLRIGRYLPESDADRDRAFCVIGGKVQAELFSGVNPLGQILRVADERFRIIGVLESRGVGLGFNPDEWIQIPVARHLRMFNRTGLFRLLVQVNSPQDLEPARTAVVRLLTERHDNEEDFTILTQDSVLSTFNRILAMLTATLAGIAAISLTVAGVGIMNVMLVSVSERTREIGLLKAVGAAPVQVLLVFLVEAALLSTSGGIVGLAMAFATTHVLGYIYPSFPITPPQWAVVSALVVSLGVGMLFGALPAYRAARLDPVAALARR